MLDGTLLEGMGGGVPLWSITDVRFGHRQDWPLHVRLQRGSNAMKLIFESAVSFRAHDESEILGHWQQRTHEGVPVGTVYEIAESSYLNELSAGVNGLARAPTKHFLVAGNDLCVEVLATAPPKVAQVQ